MHGRIEPTGRWFGADGERGFRVALAALLLAAVTLRIWAVQVLAPDPRISQPVLDAEHYLELGRRLARGDGWPPGAHFFGPLYPWLLGQLYRLWPAEPLTVQIAQSLLGVATLCALVLATRRWLGAAAALGAGALYVLNGPVLAMESQVLMESLLLFLGTTALWLWPRSEDPPARLAGFGICCGLLAAGRGTYLLLPGTWLMAHLWAARHAPGARMWARALVVGLAVLVPLLPQTVQQTRETGSLQVLTLNAGVNAYIGNNPTAQGIFSTPPGLDLHEDVTGTRSASVLAGRELSTVEAGRFWTERAFEFVRAHPDRATGLIATKALLFFSPDEIPQIDDFQALAAETPPLRATPVRFWWVLPTAALGVAVIARRPRGRAGLVPGLALIGVAWVQTVVFFAAGRYRLPVMGAFLGFAGAGVTQLLQSLRARRWWLPALVVAACALHALAPPGYPREKARSFDAYQLGKRCTRAGNYLQALVHYDRAAQLWPAAGEVWHDRGVALMRLGRFREAVTSYERALESRPTSAVTWYALGAARHQAGQSKSAIEALERAVALSPVNPRYRIDLGIALAAQGRRAEAAAQWNAVLKAEPANPEARALLGGEAPPP